MSPAAASTRYEPGTVAVITALNQTEPYRAYFDGKTWRECENPMFCVDTPATIRPLVVLDLNETIGRSILPSWIRAAANKIDDPLKVVVPSSIAKDLRYIADQIEAQTKPPRIPEPGWGAIVEAGVVQHDERLRWQRSGDSFWYCENVEENARNWGELVDPVLVRDGIEDTP